MYNKYFIITYISHVYTTCCVPHTCAVAKDPDVAQTMEADSTATSRVCVNLGAAEEEDSDDVMDDSGQRSVYTSHQYVHTQLHVVYSCVQNVAICTEQLAVPKRTSSDGVYNGTCKI